MHDPGNRFVRFFRRVQIGLDLRLRGQRRRRRDVRVVHETGEQRPRRDMVGLALEHAAEGLDRPPVMALRGVDLRERHGRHRLGLGSRRDVGRLGSGERPDAIGCVRQVQTSLDDARDEIACLAEEASAAPQLRLVGVWIGAEQLVDQLGPREDPGASDARRLRPDDQALPVQTLELTAIHDPILQRFSCVFCVLHDLRAQLLERAELLLPTQSPNQVDA